MFGGQIKSTTRSIQSIFLSIFQRLAGTYPFIPFLMYGMICISPIFIIPFLSEVAGKQVHPFLVSVISSFLSILPIWNYILGSTEQKTLLSCFLMCQAVVLLSYSITQPSVLCEVIAALFILISDARYDVICLLLLLYLHKHSNIFLTTLAFGLWVSNPYFTLLLLFLFLSTVYIQHLHFYQRLLLWLASLIAYLSPKQSPIIQLSYSYPQQFLNIVLHILLIILMLSVPCPMELLILQVCSIFLPSLSFFSLFGTALTPILLIIVTLRFVSSLTSPSVKSLLIEIQEWIKRNEKKRVIAWIILVISVLILVGLELSSLLSHSYLSNMMYEGVNRKLTRQILLEAREMLNVINENGILLNDVLKVTTMDDRSLSLWKQVVSEPEEGAFYVLSSLPYHYLLFSPFDHNGMEGFPYSDLSIYGIVKGGNNSASDLRYGFERVYSTTSNLFILYHIVQ